MAQQSVSSIASSKDCTTSPSRRQEKAYSVKVERHGKVSEEAELKRQNAVLADRLAGLEGKSGYSIVRPSECVGENKEDDMMNQEAKRKLFGQK